MILPAPTLLDALPFLFRAEVRAAIDEQRELWPTGVRG